MKKVIFIVFCTICTLVLSPLKKVSARECAYGIPSPKIYWNGNWAYGQTVKLKTSASSCLAANMSVYFDSGSYGANSTFNIEAYLMEEDQDPNEDDRAKYYIGYNNPYKYADIQWRPVESYPGNLDSAGDQTCELYMKFRIVESRQIIDYFDDDLFRYTICVD